MMEVDKHIESIKMYLLGLIGILLIFQTCIMINNCDNCNIGFEEVDKFCYKAHNELAEQRDNKTYINSWGTAYRKCILYNMNINE